MSNEAEPDGGLYDPHPEFGLGDVVFGLGDVVGAACPVPADTPLSVAVQTAA